MKNSKDVKMKKSALLICLFTFVCCSNMAFSQGFETLENITPVQLQKLSQIQHNFSQENNALETKIMDYTNKINQVKNDVDKTKEQVSLLTGAYERNLSTLKAQQKLLQQQTDALYKSVLTPEQYNDYRAQQIQVQDAFKNFLQK